MQGLGELEGAVMEVVWRSSGPLTVREVLAEITKVRPLAYTTVMTVLDNLYRKGWVTRKRHARAYLYSPSASREEAAARALRELLASTGNPDGALLHFVRSASAGESALLRRGLEERTNE